MRVYSDIDEERERLVVTFVGTVTMDDIAEMTRTSRVARMLHFQLLCDARKAAVTMAGDDLPRFQAMVRELALQSRLGQTAVVVARETDLIAIDRLADLATKFCDVRGFLESSRAERWLGWT